MKLGEVSPGGVGVGLMGMLVYALLAVFIAGLMVGRTPEYLGKKIQAAEMKLVVLYLIAMPLASLAFAAAAVVIDSASSTLLNPDPTACRRCSTTTARPPTTTARRSPARAPEPTGHRDAGLAMLMGRFFLIVAALAIGGRSPAERPRSGDGGDVPDRHAVVRSTRHRGDRDRDRPHVFPALTLGPIVEHLSL